MDYSKHTLDNGTEIYVVQSDMYTHTTARVSLYSRSSKGNAAKTLASHLLMEGSRNYPTRQAISLASDREFGAAIGTGAKTAGDLHGAAIAIKVLTNEALTAGHNPLENMVGLLAEVLNNPLMDEGRFNDEYFARKKQELALSVKQAKLDKGERAKQRFLETALGRGNSFVLPATGEEDEIMVLGNETTAETYRDLIAACPRKIFVGTHLAPEYIHGVFARHLGGMPKVKTEIFIGNAPEKQPRTRIEEPSEFDQSMVFAGFPLEVPAERLEREALMLLNVYLGGYFGSRLMTEIRIKRNMAYYAVSELALQTGILACKSAVDQQNKDITIGLMQEEVEKAIRGDISKEGFEEAKNYALNSLLRGLHAKDSRMDFVAAKVLENKPSDIDSYEERLKSVSYDDVIRAAARIHNEPIVYCQLQGEKQ
ncbi:MAG: insulinase family protein [Nanoarchaeota archaeon]|nr:insulinase family protein [Nanoarchaeota archaeon]